MKNSTSSADENRIEAVRERARADEAMALIEELSPRMRTGGRRFTREEINER